MSYEKFVAAGADVVNGSVFLNRKLVGQWIGTDFIVHPEGEAFLEAETPEAPAPVVKAKSVKAPAKAAPVDPNTDLLSGLDDLTS